MYFFLNKLRSAYIDGYRLLKKGIFGNGDFIFYFKKYNKIFAAETFALNLITPSMTFSDPLTP